MITDYEKIFALRQPWPPNDADTQTRLALYAVNDLLFKGRHNAVWEDALRRLRGDKKGDLRVILNFHKILSRLWADLVCGEIPVASSPEESQDLTLKRIIRDNLLWIGVQDGIHDFSKYGTNVRKIRFLKRGIIENVPPKYWFPIVSIQNVKEIKAHVIAYTIDTENKTSYLKAEIHRPPLPGEVFNSFVIEHRLYLLKKGKIDSGPLPLDSLAEFAPLAANPIEETKLNDFDIIVIENIPPTDELHGIDDYSDINSIVRELEMRYAQILGIEDKFSDPWMYGPPIEEQDPRDGEYHVMGGSRYISLMEGQAPPGMITWPADLPANFQVIDSLMQRLYEVSETCKVAFDASQAGSALSGSALSGTALRLMMSRPLSKAARIKLRYDAALKKEAYLCSLIEVNHGMDGATEIIDYKIEWKDGLPDDPMENAQIDATLINSKARSAEGRMRDHGFSKDQILQEQNEMMDQVL